MNATLFDKRYQVFLSSTYKDLMHERNQVIHALLSLECFPIAMEHFPASYEQQWDYIEPLIDSSDIFICLIGGKYGSCDNTGLSFTQREFEHATKMGIPTLVFFHEDISSLISSNVESCEIARLKLEEFTKLAKSTQLCKSWKNADQLPGLVTVSVINVIKHSKPFGWQSCRTKSMEFLKLELDYSELKIQLKEVEQRECHAPVCSFSDYEESSSVVHAALKAEMELATNSGYPLKIRMLGVCLHKSLPTLRKFLKYANASCRIEVRIAILNESEIAKLDARWRNLYDLFQRDIQDLIENLRFRGDSVNVSIKMCKYIHMPNWHGILIAYKHLFLGHCLWHEDGTLTVGQNPYDQYLCERSTTHDRKINQYIKWFDYCRTNDKRSKSEQLIFESSL